MLNNRQIEIRWPIKGESIRLDNGIEYTIGDIISDAGSFGLIYGGSDTFKNSVAIKVLKPSSRPFEVVREQWQKEVSILNKVRHPNVVFLYDAFISGNLFYIAFERAWGSLFDLICQEGPLQESSVKEIARQLLGALYYIHREGIGHRDLTVYNILFFQNGGTGKGSFKISDFGISEEFSDSWSSTSKVAHNFFKPPELLTFGYTTLQSDLYHLGIVLFFCLTGNFPYDLRMRQDDIDRAILSGVPRVEAERLGTPFGIFISILLRRREEYRFKTDVEAFRYLSTIL